MYIYICIYSGCIYINICTHIHIYTHTNHTHTSRQPYTQPTRGAYTHTHIHIHTYIHTYTYLDNHTHAVHTHIHTHRRSIPHAMIPSSRRLNGVPFMQHLQQLQRNCNMVLRRRTNSRSHDVYSPSQDDVHVRLWIRGFLYHFAVCEFLQLGVRHGFLNARQVSRHVESAATVEAVRNMLQVLAGARCRVHVQTRSARREFRAS